MDWKTLVNEASIALALVVTIAGVVIVSLWAAGDITGSELPTIGLVLAGALAGTKIPKP